MGRSGRSIDESQALRAATAFGIASAAPNPFNPETRITLTVPLAGQVTADVFDVLGRHVATLVEWTASPRASTR